MADTRQEAQEIKEKYALWYDDEQVNYMKFKDSLISTLTGVEIKEGQEGFGYE